MPVPPDGVPRRRLRLWPGVLLAVLLLALKVVAPLVAPQATPLGVLAGPLLGLLIGVWWAFFSRAPRAERFGAIVLIAAAMLVASRFLHVSIATGMMGYMFLVFAMPVLALALVAWALATERWSERPRWIALVLIVLIASGAWTLLRTGGFSGYVDHDFAWRWTQTAEERLLAQANDEPPPAPAAAAAAAGSQGPAAASQLPAGSGERQAASSEPQAPSGEREAASGEAAGGTREAVSGTPVAGVLLWPGFRGPSRDGVVHGAAIRTDWSAAPPVEMWRRPVGPGWSSFAVLGDLIYTQEQRGEDEVVSAYSLTTGKPVWRHHDKARFWESNGGPGPRATPAIADGRVYTLGATGLVNALDARTGARLWSQDAAKDTGARRPEWGFAGSPLVVDGLVVVAASGVLAAYDARTGARRWIGPEGSEGYSSPQLATIDGVKQVLLMSGTGLASVSLADGAPLWRHEWKGFPIVQPALTPDGGVLIVANEMSGTRRLAVKHSAGTWAAEERWTSNGLKPWFNDFVVHKGHAFGFDGTILACIDLADGTRKWKGGRYGGGQLVLLPDQDALLVISEQGELALVSASPDGFREVARAAAIEGKTWNHPVIAGNVLLVRNGEQMAAFRLASR
ncbi:MAG TPA: PQQ-binding-like beta-propeller repeat protein [Vicinamibacterales bacterium]|nr:PQQ-binding-like beta-propeller repeat protein [Vicinamibacterales bacterium]